MLLQVLKFQTRTTTSSYTRVLGLRLGSSCSTPLGRFETLLGNSLEYFQLWKVCLSQGNLEIVDSTNNLLKEVHFVFLKDFILLNF